MKDEILEEKIEEKVLSAMKSICKYYEKDYNYICKYMEEK